MYKRNIEVCLRNPFCPRKAIGISYFECVCSLSHPACNVHVLYYIVTSGLSAVRYFSYYTSMVQFSENTY